MCSDTQDIQLGVDYRWWLHAQLFSNEEVGHLHIASTDNYDDD